MRGFTLEHMPLLVVLSLTLVACSSKQESVFNLADQMPFLDKAAQEPGAFRTDSGLIYRELRLGTGLSPLSTDTVQVHYRGMLINGKVSPPPLQVQMNRPNFLSTR